MNFAAFRSATRNTPPQLLPSTNYLRQPCVTPSGLRLRRRCSGASSQTTDHDNDSDMEAKKMTEEDETLKVKARDVMAHSFGDGYSTRSDEEGFGGIYGGNQPGVIKHDKEIHEDHPEYDKTQGSDVKEKETARNQTSEQRYPTDRG